MLIKNNIKQINDKQKKSKVNEQPKVRPYKFRLGTIKKGEDNRYWKVIKKDKTKLWTRASRQETMCQNFLKK